MAASQTLLLLLVVLFTLVSATVSRQPFIIQIPSARDAPTRDNDLNCSSWRLSVETNNAGSWKTVPSKCVSYVQDYVTGDKYRSDFEVVALDSLAFANTLDLAADEMDAWVFDIDETLLSNLPYYAAHGFGSEPFDESSFDQWVDLAEAPALPASRDLYEKLKTRGFTIFLLTGRSEYQRSATEKNLLSAGYSGWKRLILRGESDQGKNATLFKSQKRSELIYKGYRIIGSSGDQWSDLLGFAVAQRSFKLPNPMYYIA